MSQEVNCQRSVFHQNVAGEVTNDGKTEDLFFITRNLNHNNLNIFQIFIKKSNLAYPLEHRTQDIDTFKKSKAKHVCHFTRTSIINVIKANFTCMVILNSLHILLTDATLWNFLHILKYLI